MDTRTTLDFKATIQNWKVYQQRKLQNKLTMDGRNTFPCTFTLGADVVSGGILSIFSTWRGHPQLEVRSLDRILSAMIFLSDVRGFNIAGNTIELTLNEELFLEHRRSITLTFPTEAVCVVAFEILQDFSRNPLRQPTPPSSNEDDL